MTAHEQAITEAAVDVYNKLMVYPRNYSLKEKEEALERLEKLRETHE